MSAALDDILKKLEVMPPEQREALTKQVDAVTKGMAWIPSPGPQTDAYFSKADVLLYGGEPGGGKSSLLLGLALTQHTRSLIMRRQYTDLSHLTEEAVKFHGSRDGFSNSPPPRLRTQEGRLLEFFAAKKVGDEQHRQGNPFDLLAVDETTQFAQSQIQFLQGWLRSTKDGQRKRVVFATNPPLTAEGLWVTEMFAPWLSPKFANPAKPGELRWAIMGDDDQLVWVDDEKPVWSETKQKWVEPKSYTFIPASVQDNPYLAGTGYDKQLDSMPTEIHRVLMGGFREGFKDSPNQIIPTDWIRQAQSRWTPRSPDNVPMCAMGVDCSGGGADPMVIAPRYDGWFAEIVEIPGKEMPIESLGKTAVGHIIANRKDHAEVIIDLGGGYGGAAYEHMIDNDIPVTGYKGAEGSIKRTKDGKLGFTNTRTAALWGFREALDPDQPGGSPIALPHDNTLLADLTAPTFEVTPNGIKAESKEKVCERIGRSTDRGDGVVMAWFYGARESTHALDWLDRQHSKRGQAPKVVMSKRHRR